MSHIYQWIPWEKIGRNAWEFWTSRVKSSAIRAGTVNEFMTLLTERCGMMAFGEDVVPCLEQLAGHDDEVLETLRTEHIPLAMRAVVLAKARKSATRKGGQIDGAA